MELIKAVIFGIVQGITEWLPISSTGHLLLVDELIALKVFDDVCKKLYLLEGLTWGNMLIKISGVTKAS